MSKLVDYSPSSAFFWIDPCQRGATILGSKLPRKSIFREACQVFRDKQQRGSADPACIIAASTSRFYATNVPTACQGKRTRIYVSVPTAKKRRGRQILPGYKRGLSVSSLLPRRLFLAARYRFLDVQGQGPTILLFAFKRTPWLTELAIRIALRISGSRP
ncbi:hypothetical protein KM043_012579 [Ampulex compressa]|nr:hypothetical protein KM043_012579 [Ampulex compressa]